MTLTLDGVKVRYGPLEALHGVTLTIPEGAVTAILGRNGAGKTSLLRAIAGSVRTSDGHLAWHGVDITGDSPARRAAQGIMLIPADAGVFRSLTVRENLELFAGRGHGHSRGDGVESGSRGTARSAAFVPALEAFPALEELLDRRASLLSGGEQQMLALSRALLTPWRLLLVDELSHGLAPVIAARLYAVLGDLVAGGSGAAASGAVGHGAAVNRTVLLAEPHPRDALHLARHVHVLRRGDVAFSGPPADLDPDSL
jgi:branched-chain amino acid transport system ATP-binding protein